MLTVCCKFSCASLRIRCRLDFQCCHRNERRGDLRQGDMKTSSSLERIDVPAYILFDDHTGDNPVHYENQFLIECFEVSDVAIFCVFLLPSFFHDSREENRKDRCWQYLFSISRTKTNAAEPATSLITSKLGDCYCFPVFICPFAFSSQAVPFCEFRCPACPYFSAIACLSDPCKGQRRKWDLNERGSRTQILIDDSAPSRDKRNCLKLIPARPRPNVSNKQVCPLQCILLTDSSEKTSL